jgi:hypothetical protein
MYVLTSALEPFGLDLQTTLMNKVEGLDCVPAVDDT